MSTPLRITVDMPDKMTAEVVTGQGDRIFYLDDDILTDAIFNGYWDEAKAQFQGTKEHARVIARAMLEALDDLDFNECPALH